MDKEKVGNKEFNLENYLRITYVYRIYISYVPSIYLFLSIFIFCITYFQNKKMMKKIKFVIKEKELKNL